MKAQEDNLVKSAAKKILVGVSTASSASSKNTSSSSDDEWRLAIWNNTYIYEYDHGVFFV